MSKIETLTKEQIDLQKVVRDEWIDIALHKQNFDKEELEAGIKWLYYSSNLKEPKVVFVKSPKDFAKKLLPKKSASVWASVRYSVRYSVGDSVWASVRDSVRYSVWASVRDSVWASVRDSVSWTSLAYDSDWGAYYDYWTRIEAITPQEKADKYIGFLKAGAFFVMMFEKKCFVMSRPIYVEQDERKRLHSDHKMAIEFSDGTGEYKLHGVTFDKKWWTKIVNDKMSPEEIFAIDNLEHRRIAYEYMDKTKMKKLKDFKVLDETIDTYGNPMKVISFTVKGVDEPLKYLNVFCPTTKREYFLGTNEDKCNQAKAQSFGFKELVFEKEW